MAPTFEFFDETFNSKSAKCWKYSAVHDAIQWSISKACETHLILRRVYLLVKIENFVEITKYSFLFTETYRKLRWAERCLHQTLLSKFWRNHRGYCQCRPSCLIVSNEYLRFSLTLTIDMNHGYKTYKIWAREQSRIVKRP